MLRAGILLLCLIAAPAFAADGAVLVLADDPGDPAVSRRAGTVIGLSGLRPNLGAEARPLEAALGAELAWLGLPPQRCPGAPSPVAALDEALTAAGELLQFARADEALQLLDAAAGTLPCLDDVPPPETLYRLWFLAGATRFLLDERGLALIALRRAAGVDPEVPFDELFPASLRDLLLDAKADLLDRTPPQLAALVDGAVFVNGRPVDGSAPMPPGRTLVQVRRADGVQTAVLDTDGAPGGLVVSALVDAASVRAAVEAAFDAAQAEEPSPNPTLDGVLASWLAGAGEPWLLLVDARKRPAGPRRLLRLDAFGRALEPVDSPALRGDLWARRVRLGVPVEYRGQINPESRQRVDYLQTGLVVWLPVHPLVKGAIGLTFAFTDGEVPDDRSFCCFLPEGSFRLRVEAPRGLVGVIHPYGELRTVLTFPWPAGQGFAGGPGSILQPAWGAGLSGGAVFTPTLDQRFGIQAEVAAGIITQLGFELHVGAGFQWRL